MNTTQLRARESSMDALRLLACFMVVLLHTAAERSYISEVTRNWRVFNWYITAARSCVPLFVMLSGKLFLGKRELPGYRTLFFKYILKLGVLYVFWGLFYALDTVGDAGGIKAVILSFVVEPKSHLWYLPCIMALYLLMPCMWAIAKYRDGKYLGYACALFLLLGVVRNTYFAVFTQESALRVLISRVPGNFGDYCGYFLLGYYLSNEKKFRIHPAITAAAALVVILLSCWLEDSLAVRTGVPGNLLHDYLMLPACLEAVLIFLTFRNWRLSWTEAGSKRLAVLSKCTLFVYLFHVFLLQHLYLWFGLAADSFNPVFSVPVLSLGVFAVSLLLGWLLNKIPLVNRWLM